KTGIICDWSDTASVEQGIAELYDRWERGALKLDPNHEEIRKYDRRVLTEKLAGILGRMESDKPR
ncbi:MAG TPA: hypothetical protein PK369_07405, partial [Thermoclostridium sp.]|nr:hypothetical protein [Thermoclostridium sp.]